MYNKLFTKILDSSIWLEPASTRVVWITFLAAMDRDGYAHFSAMGNLAQRAMVTLEEAERAVAVLEAPDRESGDPTSEGRRIERVPGGWVVINAGKHRDLITAELRREQTRERVRLHRERKRTVTPVTHVANSNDLVAPSEALSEAGSDPDPERSKPSITRRAARAVRVFPSDFVDFWNAYPKKVGKGAALKCWAKLTPDVSAILRALAWQVTQPAWTKDGGQFIPHPATWLNRQGWEDEPFHPPADTSAPQTKGHQTIANVRRALARLEEEGRT